MRRRHFLLFVLLLLQHGPSNAVALEPEKVARCTGQTDAWGLALEKGFQSPPNVARPEILWYWVNGNLSKEGITLDLEAMQRIGLRAALIYEVGPVSLVPDHMSSPKGPVVIGTPLWLEMMEHASKEAKRLGLQLGFFNGSGWSSSGGPWITPELAMQQLSWSSDSRPVPHSGAWLVSQFARVGIWGR